MFPPEKKVLEVSHLAVKSLEIKQATTKEAELLPRHDGLKGGYSAWFEASR